MMQDERSEPLVTWMAIFVPALVCLALIFVPGLLVATAVRVRGFDAVALSPALSVAIIALSAIFAPVLGISWALWVPFAFALVLAALGWIMVWLSTRYGVLDLPSSGGLAAGGGTLVDMRWFSKNQLFYYVSFAIGAVLLFRNITNGIGRPDWISQTYDVNFHLNAIRYIADQGNGSSLFLSSMTAGDGKVEFYPAAWHDVASLIYMATGAPVPVVANTFVVIIGAVIWPLSVIFLIRNTLRVNQVAILTIGALSAAYVAFPLLLLQFGVLYPNLLGIALMPVGLAIVAQMFRVVQVRRFSTAQSVYLGVFVALGIALAHPNVIMSLLVMVVPIFLTRAVLQILSAARRETKLWLAALHIAGIGLILFIIRFLWQVVRPPEEAGGWEPYISQPQAFGEFMLNGVMHNGALWFVSALFMVGVIALVNQKNRSIWILGTTAVVCYYWIAISAFTWAEGRDWATGVWYHDPNRVAAMVPLAVLPLAVLGVHALAECLINSRFAHAILERVPSTRRGLTAITLVSILAVGSTAYFGQTAKSLTDYVDRMYGSYAPRADAPLLSSDEYKVLEELDNYVPEDDTVIVQAWTGAPLAYAVADRRVTAYHTVSHDSADVTIINEGLNRVGIDPTVCQAIERERAYYYLDFGTQEILNANHSVRYSGFKDAAQNPGLEALYNSGDTTLYRITACQ